MEGRVAPLRAQSHRAQGSPLSRSRTRRDRRRLPPRGDSPATEGLRASSVRTYLRRVRRGRPPKPRSGRSVGRQGHGLVPGSRSRPRGAVHPRPERGTASEQWRMSEHGTLYDAVDRTTKPILAMINGYCFGGGLELAMACDIRIASERATLGQTEINIGIIPGGGASQRLPRLVGLGNALKLTLTGDRIDAAEALRVGLVDEVVPHARLEGRTFEVADRIASRSALTVRLAKAAVRSSARLPLDQGLRYEQSLFSLAMASEDKEEGVRAFLEKREPRWKDR